MINTLNKISYGMYVVSAKKENKYVGCIVNSVIQVTSTPASIAVSINKNNYTSSALNEGSKLSLSILTTASPSDIIGTFGFKSSKDVNKFENAQYKIVDDLPVLLQSGGYLILKVKSITNAGSHNIYLCDVISGEAFNADEPMTYDYYKRVIKGKSPKNAPTYVNEEPSNNEIYVCPICGYEYSAQNPSFQELPDTWVCPICGVPKKVFVKK